MGAWIEIYKAEQGKKAEEVAPLVGAWIEIDENWVTVAELESLLSWERGLKSFSHLSTASS